MPSLILLKLKVSIMEQSEVWLSSLITKTPQDGYELAIKLSRMGVKYTQPDARTRVNTTHKSPRPSQRKDFINKNNVQMCDIMSVANIITLKENIIYDTKITQCNRVLIMKYCIYNSKF